MAGSWTSERFPQHEKALLRLVEQHRELEDEPLHLALAYLPAHRDQQHVYLFEVIGSRWESVSPDNDLFEVAFPPSTGFPMEPNEELHLILTNPRELNLALERNWPLASEVVKAIGDEDYEVLFKDEVGEKILDQLRAHLRRQEVVLG
jgi:hypothetical protein